MFQGKPAFIDRWRSICQAMLDLPIWSNPMECSALLLDLAEPSALRATIGRPRSKAARQQTAELSHPHIAMADRAGNIYIADKEAHSIRKVLPDGRIFTVAG